MGISSNLSPDLDTSIFDDTWVHLWGKLAPSGPGPIWPKIPIIWKISGKLLMQPVDVAVRHGLLEEEILADLQELLADLGPEAEKRPVFWGNGNLQLARNGQVLEL